MVLVNLLSILLDPWDGDELSWAAAAGGKLPQGSGDFSDSLSAHFDWQRWKKNKETTICLYRIKLNCHVKLLKKKRVSFLQCLRLQSWWRGSETSTTNGFLMYASWSRSSTASRRYRPVPPPSRLHKMSLSTTSSHGLSSVAPERGHPGSPQADQAQPHRGQRGVQPPTGHSAQ